MFAKKELGRKWRTDFMILFGKDKRLALELEGGLWSFGRHNRPASMIKDIEKYNSYTLLGIPLIRIIPAWVKDGSAIEIIKKYIDKYK